ncbi:MAG: response regulator transcription factor [Rubrivivax sp.]|nr:response regulator transcription factor [Rubrivivax sp.]
MTLKPAAPSHAPSADAGTDGPATALIAEDEPLLARALERQLAAQWPALRIVARAEDGPSAVERALAHRPDILLLDIQMPGATGLEAAAEIADEWEGGEGFAGTVARPNAGPPLVVFVTAYDRYAVQAFERAAVDYLLKPVTPERLAETVARLRARLAQRAAAAAGPSAGADLLRQVQEAERQAQPGPALGGEPDAAAAEERIRVIRAAEGTRVRMIPLPEVIAFEAADKYVNVVTEQGGDALIRMSLRELALRLEGVEFTQVHRGVLVNAERIVGAERDEAGHYWLTLRGLKRPLKVSRAFSHLFKPM